MPTGWATAAAAQSCLDNDPIEDWHRAVPVDGAFLRTVRVLRGYVLMEMRVHRNAMAAAPANTSQAARRMLACRWSLEDGLPAMALSRTDGIETGFDETFERKWIHF